MKEIAPHHFWLAGYQQQLKSQPIIYKALYQHIESAIAQGLLRAGDKLPAQRQLAKQLSIAVATVTRVYKLAEQQGLLFAKIGNGSFVSTCPTLPQAIKAHDYQSINLSIIKPQVALGSQALQQQLTALSQQSNLTDLMDYNPAGGSLTDKQTAKTWLLSQGVAIENKAISICSGAQHALSVLLNVLTQHGDTLAVEDYCYPGIISLANQLGRKLTGIAMDEQGMLPKALEQACQQHTIKVVIIVASHQNPTAAVMGFTRRKQIAKIAKKYQLLLIDDDVYGFLQPNLPPISNFLPLQSFYLTSLSKSIFPGLRVGYIVAPTRFNIRIEAEIRNSIWMPVPLTLALASRIIHSGQAKEIMHQQQELAIKRQKIALRILTNCPFLTQTNSYHLWLVLPHYWSSKRFCEAVEQQGVLLSSAEYFSAENNNKTSAVRISLMAAKSEQELAFALNIVKKTISTPSQQDMAL